MSADHVTLTNPHRTGGHALLAQVFYADPDGHVESAALESRVIDPGITAILTLREGNYLVVQRVPTPEPDRARCVNDLED